MTGFSYQQRHRIITRDDGLCRRCLSWTACDIHHRRPRGMGGSPAANTLANGVLLCRACHVWVESHRQEAFATGWLVHRGGSPADTPVVDIWGRTARLTDDGRITFTGPEREPIGPADL